MSKGLEALEIVKEECNYAFGVTANGNRVRKNLPIIEKELKEKEKQDKVIMIIQTKGVDILDLRVCTFSRYNQHRSLEGSFCLTKEEYDLLKEVML